MEGKKRKKVERPVFDSIRNRPRRRAGNSAKSSLKKKPAPHGVKRSTKRKKTFKINNEFIQKIETKKSIAERLGETRNADNIPRRNYAGQKPGRKNFSC
jgi:hypothetical protein